MSRMADCFYRGCRSNLPFLMRMKTVVSVKVDEEVKEKLREQAKANGMSFNQMMEEILEHLMFLSGNISVYEYVSEMADFEKVMRSS